MSNLSDFVVSGGGGGVEITEYIPGTYTYTKKPTDKFYMIKMWSGGGGGGASNTGIPLASGGGGGGYFEFIINAADLTTVISLNVGAGGSGVGVGGGNANNGSPGGDTVVQYNGKTITVTGGAGGRGTIGPGNVEGVAGGGLVSDAVPLEPALTTVVVQQLYAGGEGGSTSITRPVVGGRSIYGGGGSSAVGGTNPGGSSVYGGGAGASSGGPGTSINGGSGGDRGSGFGVVFTDGSPGETPSGGGGAYAGNTTLIPRFSGAGGDGKVILYVFS
jgi:hypothetical protein